MAKKGKNGEREVAKLIQPWWQQLEPNAEFASTPGSGGWRTSRVIRADMKLAGDLITNASRFPFTVEVKRRESWSEDRLRSGRRSPVWKWWIQTQEDAADEGGVPMLWFRQNRRPWYVMLPVSYVFNHVIQGWLQTEMAWRSRLGRCVSLGDHFPTVFLGSTILKADPSLFAKGKS